MKKIIFAIISLATPFFLSCSNDEIGIESIPVGYTTSVTLSPSNFFSSYNFYDTRHNINQLGDSYRTFNSEHNLFIQSRTLFYNKQTGELVDSLLTYTTTTNDITKSIDLPAGTYYALSTVTFARKRNNDYVSWWYLVEKENIETVRMRAKGSKLEDYPNWRSQWAIMSTSTEEFTVSPGAQASVRTTPKPVGAVAYVYFQNFQYANQASYGTVTDNGMRSLAIYSQRIAYEYKLNPNAVTKYNYYSDGGSISWGYLSDKFIPSSFDDDWDYFQSNLYDYTYILAPECNLCFGYMKENDTSFKAYGTNNYTIQQGATYLAYWDHFQIGNPYFGIADNNHWNTYSTNTKAGASAHFSKRMRE